MPVQDWFSMKYKRLPTDSSEIENKLWLGISTTNQNSCVDTGQ